MISRENWQQQLVHDLDSGMAIRINSIIQERNVSVEGDAYIDFENQYYGNRTSALVRGMRAACEEWSRNGSRGIEELKEQYSGDFVDGVTIGAKAVVSSDNEFTFTHTDTSEDSKNNVNNSNNFTFTQ